MQTRIESREGWIEIARDGIHLLAKGDDSLAARLEAALAGADGDDPTDVVTDELSTGGIRRTPDFALVDETSGRVLVRGAASVAVTRTDGSTQTVSAPARGPWADEDLEGDVADVVLGTGEPETAVEPAAIESEPEMAPETTTEAEALEPADAVETPAAAAPAASAAPEAPAEPGATGLQSGGTGWAMPSVFGRDTQAGPEQATPAPTEQAPTDQVPVEEAEIVETPAPAGQDLVADQPQDGAAPDAAPTDAALDAPSDDDDELPSFDFLFGNTQHHRSSLLAASAADASQDAPIDSGPVAAAGGFQPSEDPAGATLAPPSEEDGHPEPTPSGPTVADHSGGLPPMPGSAPFVEEPDQVDPADDQPAAPVAVGGPARVQAARDDAPGHEPGGGRPQFADGHLVGSRVPQAASSSGTPSTDSPGTSGPAGDSGPSPATSEADDSSGVISSVPWGAGAAPVAGPVASAPGMPFGLPALPTPDAGAAQTADPEPAAAEGAEGDGPMVLSVRCSSGHHNAPHATRCRVCGQDLPSQQPEPTPRPALGQLRLSTGDVVTLDRGVLIGRAPRAADTGAGSPHLVRISSPDNEISRNHVEIVLDGWHVLVRDLGSTNGTTVALPGSSPIRVRPGDQQTIEPGTTITLADQVSMVFEVTG